MIATRSHHHFAMNAVTASCNALLTRGYLTVFDSEHRPPVCEQKRPPGTRKSPQFPWHATCFNCLWEV